MTERPRLTPTGAGRHWHRPDHLHRDRDHSYPGRGLHHSHRPQLPAPRPARLRRHGLDHEAADGAGLSIGELPSLDFVVLSHHHGDHFDRVAARGLDHDLPVITEPHAACKLRKQGFRSPVPLSTWQSRVITHADGDAEVRVTSLPGQHAPRPLGYVVPPVMGSLLDFSRDGRRLLRLYITGDTLMHDGIGQIAERFGDIDLCLIHLGGTKVAGILLTMDGRQGVQALRTVAPREAIPIHYDDYTLFKSPLPDFRKAAGQAGLPTVIHYLNRGDSYRLDPSEH
jgi:L-ascorbate metabolism protein UlaG (beta-lactamase superfamily)